MPQPARQILAVRRDNRGRIKDFVLLRDNGTKVVLSVEEALRAQEAQEYCFFVNRRDESLLVTIDRLGEQIVVSAALDGPVNLPDEG